VFTVFYLSLITSLLLAVSKFLQCNAVCHFHFPAAFCAEFVFLTYVAVTVTIKMYLILVYSTYYIFLSVLADLPQPIIPLSSILMHAFPFSNFS